MARKSQHHPFLDPEEHHLGKTDSAVANLDTMVGVAKGTMEGTAQRHLGRLFHQCGRWGKVGDFV